jgi:NAD(P)H-flavin reductase/ferredoxin
MFKFFEKKQYQLTVDGYPPIQLEHKETVLNGAIRSNINFPHSCKAGGCATCKCKLVSGKVKELTDKSYMLTKEELDQNMILGCQSIPKSDVIIELPSDPRQQQECTGTIIEQRKLTHDIAEIIITIDTDIDYLPGQFALLSAANQSHPERSYSFAHAHTQQINSSPSISFFVRAIANGKMSNWLHSVQALNTKLNIKASFGNFYLRQTNAPMICIVGGSGLGPIIAILEQALLHSQQKQRNVILLMGARSQQDLYYQAEIESIKTQWRGAFTYKPVLSDEDPESDWQGCRGLVTDFLDHYLTNDSIHNGEGYLCGPPPMVDAAITKMMTLGVNKNKIYFDKFSDQGR